ncbi:MAG: archaellin/type IV pilin N-terminal domain-containing protein [Candidatus Bathyarchaeia archaeon]
MGNLIRNRRGLSEIISSLLLILIVASAGVVIYAYSVGAFNASASHFQLQTQLDEERVRERLQVIRVWWDTANQLNITVLNHGDIAVSVDAVYVNGTAVTNFLSGRGVFTAVGQLVNVRFVSPVAISSGSVYEIAVVTERGGRTVVSWKA